MGNLTSGIAVRKPAAVNSSQTLADPRSAAKLAALPDDALLEAVQKQTFRFFWEAAHPVSGLARDRCTAGVAPAPDDELVAIGGSGFGAMALIVGVARGWITRAQGVARLQAMLDVLCRATCYHGAFPHFMNGRTGATIPFGRKDDGGDLVETALLFQGLLCARQYFDAAAPEETRLRTLIDWLWSDVEWDWYTQGRKLLYWHWSPNNGWALDHEIHGWNECLIAYVLAAAAPRYGVAPEVYHRGYASGADFTNGRRYCGIELPLGMPFGGPLFFAHYSFCGLDPRGLRDRYSDYWVQNTAHVHIHAAYCADNPGHFAGYDADCWGLTASDDPDGYAAHDPAHDNGTLSPTAALASLPYEPQAVLKVLRHFLREYGDRIWRDYGFVDAFNPSRGWTAQTHLAIDQGPIVAMIENHRSGLLWKLFMAIPEIRTALRRLGFSFPDR